MYYQDAYCSKQTGSSSTKGNHHPSFLLFLELKRRKSSWCSQNLYKRRNVVKTETQQTFVNGLLGFITFRHLYPAKRVCIAHNNCMSCPSIWAPYLHCSLIYFWVPSSCFCIVTSLRGWNLFSVSASRGGYVIHAGGGGGFTHWLTDCFDVQPTTTSGNIITQSIISALASANSSCILHRAQQTSRWRICMSVIAAFASFVVLWHFCRAVL